MKKIISLIMCFAFVLNCSGCSKTDIEHFDKSTYSDIKGTAEINETVNITIDAENLAKGVLDISNQITTFNKDKNEETEDEFAPEVNNDIYPQEEDADVFADEFLGEIRAALDENKMLNLDIGVKGNIDFDNMTADESITCKFNNISIDCGNCYYRKDKAYMDKKILYTLGSVEYLYDSYMLSEYYTALDDLLGDNKYIVIDYNKLYGNFNNNGFAFSVVDSTNVLQQAQLKFYEQAKDVLKDFDTGFVSKIENGTRFQIKSSQFAELCNKFTSYIRQHNEPAARLANDYMSLVFSASMNMYAEEDMFDKEDLISGEDVISAMDFLKEIVNTPEFSSIFRTLNITYTDDITKKDNVTNRSVVIDGTYDNKKAFSIDTDVNIIQKEIGEFADLSNVKSIDYFDIAEELMKINMNINFGDLDYINDEYTCPDCNESFKYEDTKYCDKCGFIHDFYEEDTNCGKQPGCELAIEASQSIA